MKTLKVELPVNSYEICIGACVKNAGNFFKDRGIESKILIITDSNVGKLYGKTLSDCLTDAGYSVVIAEIPAGEEHKTLDTVENIYNVCLKNNLNRDSLIVALGGGVVGDISGFVAATFMRGIRYVQMPTTLLAQVDASVGGKTGVNLKESKNLIGSFHQPLLVYTDISVLKTLKKREFASGLAEVIKCGLIGDPEFFDFLLNNLKKVIELEPETVSHVVYECCKFKKGIVEKDEKEQGIRAVLNFGHTIGHAIEAVTEYRKYMHGEAVSLGIVCAARISNKLGLLDGKIVESIENLLIDAGLPVRHSLNTDKVIERLIYDKKVKDGNVRFVLLNGGIGKTIMVGTVSSDLIKDILLEVKQ